MVTCPEGYAAFVPAPLPPRLTYSADLVLALSRADAALGELSGIAGELPDPQLLDAPFKRQEALCSARIEGAQVSLSDLLLDQVGAAPASVPRDHLREVRSCIATLRYGVERLAGAPLSLSLVRDLHENLLRGEIGGTRTPGEFRTSQSWLGPPGATLATATYVAPPVPDMLEALEAWDAFLRERGALPDLLQCAMLHAQFETIHPFVGGNGRLGRLLITLFLIDRKRLTRPLLYLSAYFEAHRDEYYRRLQRVRTHGEWEPWLLFFLAGVRQTAERGARQARALIALHHQFHDQFKGGALALADEAFRTPCLTVPQAQRTLSLSNSAARRVVRELQSAELLEDYAEKRLPRVYLARPILDAVLRPLEDLRSPAPGDAAVAGDSGTVLKSVPGQRTGPVRRADKVMAEAMAIIDAAREQGVQLRLTGGLAVRRFCTDLDFMDREYSDIDVVGLSSQFKDLHTVFAGLGYAENRYVTQATDAEQLQYVKAETLVAPPGQSDEAPHEAPIVDHVDIFLDIMRMDHDVEIRERLDIDDYAISPVDALIAKLQIGKINQKDVHDVIALLKDVPLYDADGGAIIDVAYLADTCAGDWGLYHDITTNLDVVLAMVDDYGLSQADLERVCERLASIKESVEHEAKPIGWRLRARVGERVAWRREVEDTEGTQLIAPEWDWRRDLG